MPAFPAAAMIVGAYVSRWVRGGAFTGAIEPKPVFGLLLTIGVGAGLTLLVVGDRLMPGVRWVGLIGLIPAAGAAVCLWLATRDDRCSVAAAFATTAAVFGVAALAVAAQVVSAQQLNHRLLAVIRVNAVTAPLIGSFGVLEPTWVYYLGQPIREIPEEEGAQAVSFLAQPDRFLITTRDRAEALKPGLPAGVVELERVPYFSRLDEDLVVLGRAAASAPTAVR
jgi:hypothetical protein